MLESGHGIKRYPASSPKFSMPYPDASGTGFLLPCNERILGPDNQPIGVVGVDVSMDTVIDIMQKLNLTVPHESFILNENGEVMFQTSERGQKIDANLALVGNKSGCICLRTRCAVKQIRQSLK